MKLLILLLVSSITSSWAFAPLSFPGVPLTVRKAGGFEWENPVEAFDQGVENPFKNPGLMNSNDGMRIDPARLLGPRLNGANLYFIGMMGSGKTAVGDIVARSKYLRRFLVEVKFTFSLRFRDGHVQFSRHGSNHRKGYSNDYSRNF